MVNFGHLRYSTIIQIAQKKIVPTQIKKALLGCTLLILTGLLASCGGSSSGGIYNQAFNLSGQWSGTISDNNGSTDTINTTLSDNAGSITGTLTLNGHSCLSTGSVTGTAVQDSANTTGDNPLTGDQENSNKGSVSLTLSTGQGNSVSSITVTAGGTGYTQDTDVVIGPPDLSNGVQATATATIAAGVIVGFVVTEDGGGYLQIPSVTIIDQDTQGVSSIDVVLGGLGYTAATVVAISSPDISGGIQAKAKATIVDGKITAFTVTRAGSGYTKVPSITITDTGGGHSADGLAVLSTFSGGEGAVATAVLTTTTDNPTFTLTGTSKQLSGSYSTTTSCSINSTNTVSLTRI